MDLSCYISLESFVNGCLKDTTGSSFLLSAGNLFYTISQQDYLYGLHLLKQAIGVYEEQENIPKENSKANIPFFRDHLRRLIGPEMDLFMIPFYESLNEPDVSLIGKPVLKLTVDYDALAKFCLFENLFLVRCKYNEDETLRTFVRQMDREYDKFFYNEEQTGFTADSHLFSLLCNACLEVKRSSLSEEKEWRIALLRAPSEADYCFKDGRLIPFTSVPLPLSCIRQVALLDAPGHELNYTALAGFLEQRGLAPERYLEGMQE